MKNLFDILEIKRNTGYNKHFKLVKSLLSIFFLSWIIKNNVNYFKFCSENTKLHLHTCK